MIWKTVASGSSFEDLKTLVPDRELKKGDRLKIELTLNQPVARLFDLAGAELMFRGSMPDGLDLIDVYGEGNNKVVIIGEADPIFLVAAVTFIARNWLTLALLSLGITSALGYLVTAIKVKASVLEGISIGIVVSVILGLILATLLVFKSLRR